MPRKKKTTKEPEPVEEQPKEKPARKPKYAAGPLVQSDRAAIFVTRPEFRVGDKSELFPGRTCDLELDRDLAFVVKHQLYVGLGFRTREEFEKHWKKEVGVWDRNLDIWYYHFAVEA